MRGGKRAGAGRKPGTPNKITMQLKEAILEAAHQAGGPDGMVGYLRKQATDNSASFMALLGKVLPHQIAGDKDNPMQLEHKIESERAFASLVSLLDGVANSAASDDNGDT
jgi:hypothetical protein